MSEIRRHRVTEAGPVYDQREIDAVVEVLAVGAGRPRAPGRRVRAARCGHCSPSQHGVMVNSGTSALWLAVDLLGCEPGDEVITSPLDVLERRRAAGALADRAGVRRRRTRHLSDRRRTHRGDDRPAHQGHPRAEPRGQLPGLGSHPRASPTRTGCSWSRTAATCSTRSCAAPAPALRADIVVTSFARVALDDRGGQRRPGRDGRRRVVRRDVGAPAVGPPVGDVPVRQPPGERRPLRPARRRHALRPHLRVRRHGLQLRTLRDHGGVRAGPDGQARRLQRAAAAELRARSTTCSRGHDDIVDPPAHHRRRRHDVDALPVPARRRHRSHRGAGVPRSSATSRPA